MKLPKACYFKIVEVLGFIITLIKEKLDDFIV